MPTWHVSQIEVQIRAAYTSGRHLQDYIVLRNKLSLWQVKRKPL